MRQGHLTVRRGGAAAGPAIRNTRRALLVALLVAAFMPPVATARAASISVAWDAAQDQGVIGYLVYVGTQSGIYVRVYDVGDRTSFSYEGDEGQRYYFAVAAYAVDQRVGPQSEEASGVAGAFGTTRSASAAPPLVGHTPGLITSMAALPDGRLLAIEDWRRVSVVVDGRVLPNPALTFEDPTDLHQLDQIVVDPDFATSRTVYVSQIEGMRDGRRELRITRYREVQNRLGEPAVVIAGLGLPSSGTPAFTADAKGHLFVALPSPPGASGQGANPYQGMVLRVMNDGTVPRDSRAHSPVLARGYEAPSGLAWNQASDELLLAGQDAGGQPALARLDLTVPETAVWPRIFEAMGRDEIESADLTRVLGRWRVERFGEPTAIAVGSGSSLYVAFHAPTTASWPGGTRIVRFDLDARAPGGRRLLLPWQHRR